MVRLFVSVVLLGHNFCLDELAKDRVYEFMFISTHPKISGTTRGIGNPIAIAKGGLSKESTKINSGANRKKWWPSRYGAEDELGTLNELHAGKVLEAAPNVKKGRVFDLGTEYKEENPGVSPRFWHTITLAHP